MKLIYKILTLLLFSAPLGAEKIMEIIPDYSIAGINYLEKYPQQIDFASDLNISANENKDLSAIINNYIDTVQKPAMLVFEPGEYIFKAPLKLKSDVILSGYNSNLTKLKFDFSGVASSCISIAGKVSSEFIEFEVAPQKSNNFLVSDEAGVLKTGDIVEISQSNAEWDSNPADWATNSVGQFLTVQSVSNDTIYTIEKIYIDYNLSLKPKWRRIDPIQNVILQYLSIERLDEPEKTSGYNISISKAQNCLIRGIESNKSVASHVMITGSKNCELSGSYLHHAFTYDGSGTRGYGVTLNDHSSDCKVVNNIFQHLRHAIVLKHGANGNAVAYNYAFETNRSEPISDFAGDIQLHGHYSYANLIESNLVNNIWIDDYWGPSGPRNIFYRNRCILYGFFCTSSATDSMSIVANEITGSGFVYGLYNVQGSNHFEKFNSIKGKIDNLDGDINSYPESYIYDNQPDFWDISDEFGTIGFPFHEEQNTIPAKFRYDNISRKTVGEFIPTSVAYNFENTELDLKQIISNFPEKSVSMYDYTGNLLFKGACKYLDLTEVRAKLVIVIFQGKSYKALL